MTNLKPREQRLVALFILLLLLSGVWFLVLQPLVEGFSDRAQRRTELQAELARNDRLIAGMPGLRRLLDRQRADRAHFLSSLTSREAVADQLRQRLQQSFGEAGGQLRGVGDAPARTNWVAASADGQMQLDQLVRLLDRLQATEPWLVITDLEVVADRALASGKLDLLDVKINVAVPDPRAA